MMPSGKRKTRSFVRRLYTLASPTVQSEVPLTTVHSNHDVATNTTKHKHGASTQSANMTPYHTHLCCDHHVAMLYGLWSVQCADSTHSTHSVGIIGYGTGVWAMFVLTNMPRVSASCVQPIGLACFLLRCIVVCALLKNKKVIKFPRTCIKLNLENALENFVFLRFRYKQKSRDAYFSQALYWNKCECLSGTSRALNCTQRVSASASSISVCAWSMTD